MPIKTLTLKTTPQHQGKRLDEVLAIWLPQALAQPLSKAKVRKLIVAGAVYLNRRRVRIASKIILAGATIGAHIDLQKLNQDGRAQDLHFEMDDKHILFEDEYLIAVDKPPGLPTQPTLDEARNNLFAAVKNYLVKRNHDPATYLGLHHRLDRDTSGVVLFTKKKEVNKEVADLFAKHIASKMYYALTHKPQVLPRPDWTVKNYLKRDAKSGKKARFISTCSGGSFAHTDFHLQEALPGGLWIEAHPRTGRTHQIRVHLSELGLPVLGDQTYCTPKFLAAPALSDRVLRLMLHAANLTFPHPISKLNISIWSPVPEDFKKCLQFLKTF